MQVCKDVKRHFVSVSTHALLFFINTVNISKLFVYDYILYLPRGERELDLINWNVIDATAFTTCNFQRVGTVFTDVFEVFFWEAADVI